MGTSIAHPGRTAGEYAPGSLEWQKDADCLQVDPETFFAPEGMHGGARRRREAEAGAVCAACPVLDDCRIHVLETREPYGVWGGLTEKAREGIYGAARARAPRTEADGEAS